MRPRFLRRPSSTPTRIAEVSAKVTKVEEMTEVEQETSLTNNGILDAPGGGAELLQPETIAVTVLEGGTDMGTEVDLPATTAASTTPAEPALAEAMGVGILSVAAAASSLVRSGSREMPIQCTVEESSESVEHSTGTQWVVPTIT